jgi:hypothetical protein
MRIQAAMGDEDELLRDRWRLETHDPDDAPLEPPFEDPEDPDLLPEEDEYPDEDEEYGSPAVEPHEEPLVAP